MIDFQNIDCMVGMKNMQDNSVDLTLTDIPYGECNETVHGKSNGLRNYDKGEADILTFDIIDFASEVYRLTKGTIIIFCGYMQISELYKWFMKKKGTCRVIVWEKNNPGVMNGQFYYLNATEIALYFKKGGAAFNAFCKSNVLRHPTCNSDIHPTEKNHNLLTELISDNSNEGDLVFDPCAGSGSTLYIARKGLRRVKGFETNKTFYDKALQRLNENNSLF